MKALYDSIMDIDANDPVDVINSIDDKLMSQRLKEIVKKNAKDFVPVILKNADLLKQTAIILRPYGGAADMDFYYSMDDPTIRITVIKSRDQDPSGHKLKRAMDKLEVEIARDARHVYIFFQ